MSSIKEFFSGKNIFVTGFSGFVGKALVEKLLRSCPNIGNIYVLLRSKKEVDPLARLDEICNDVIFDKIKTQLTGDWKKKIILISGDISKLNLGLSDESRRLLIENVNIVYHVAATIKFEDPFHKSIIINTRGPREMCQLVSEMKQIKLFVHISTTFCNVKYKTLEERIYPAVSDWKEAIEIAENMKGYQLSILTKKYVDYYPNTYAYTKHLAEHVVNDLCDGKIPTLIIRLPIVVSAAEEPINGWTDNFNGPTGVIVATGKGLLRVFYGNQNTRIWNAPVDQITKILLSSVYVKLTKEPKAQKLRLDVINATPSTLIPRTLYKLSTELNAVTKYITVKNMVWYPTMLFTNSTVIFYILTILLQVLPALKFDGLLKIMGKKPRLLKFQKLVYTTNQSFRYFFTKPWDFTSEKYKLLNQYIKSDESKDFIPLDTIDEINYARICYDFIQRNMLREKVTEMDYKQNQIMKTIHIVTRYCFYIIIVYIIFKKVLLSFI